MRIFLGTMFAVGVAFFFAGLYRACTGANLFDTKEDWFCVLIGVMFMTAWFLFK